MQPAVDEMQNYVLMICNLRLIVSFLISIFIKEKNYA
jgi:hypothetical protein